ncbi:MAG: sulfite exporter TauE/SafE family protein [Pseudanabaena sp. Salubria-1]|nr:sulfite exporter TauE/SafE family protein [Pseudanabaena sp. Salubria-1]
MNYFLLTGFSFIVGTVVGLTGIGGASLITPMLIFVFNVPAAIAVGSDIVAATMMKAVAGVSHWRQETVDLSIVKWLATGSVPGALLGVFILHLLQSYGWSLDSFLLPSIGTMILFVTIAGLAQLLLANFAPDLSLPSLPTFDLETVNGKVKTVAIGFVLGCMVGLTSVSSGSLFALVLMTFFKLDSRKLVGTDITQAAILLGFTSLGHLSLGTVDWHIVIPIWIGSVPGVLLGSKLCQHAPQRALRYLIFVILILDFRLKRRKERQEVNVTNCQKSNDQ